MTDDDTHVQKMTVDVLAQRCAEETSSYFKYQSNDTRYCFELFRRAIIERDDTAWKALMLQYRPSIARWVNRWVDKHPNFPLLYEEVEDFIAEAFERFWNHFTPEKFSRSPNLEGILKYLKMCVNGTILDVWRKLQRRQLDQNLDNGEAGEGPQPTSVGLTPEAKLQNDEFWELIKTKLRDDKEYTVVYASFDLALSPRQIHAEFPDVFHDIREIYQCKAYVWARLERDPEIRELVQRK